MCLCVRARITHTSGHVYASVCVRVCMCMWLRTVLLTGRLPEDGVGADGDHRSLHSRVE